jgi:hypothetical protein
VHAVGDQRHRAGRVEQRTCGTGVSVVERAHRVEQVRPERGARIERRARGGLVGVRVPERDRHAGAGQPGDGGEAAGQLRRERHEPDRAGLQERRQLGGRRRPERGRIVRAGIGGRQPGALEVHARELREARRGVGDERCERRGVRPGRGRDERCQERRHARGGDPRAGGVEAVGRREVDAEGAVQLDVDEPRHDPRALRRVAQRLDGRDSVFLDDDAARPERVGRKHVATKLDGHLGGRCYRRAARVGLARRGVT